MTKLYQLLVVLFIISFLTGCSTKKEEGKLSSPLLFSSGAISLTDLTKQDMQDIIEIVGIIIPIEETEVSIRKLSFCDDDGYYNIEFDGISDIDGFIDVNKNLLSVSGVSFDGFSKFYPDEYYLSIFIWTKSNGEIIENVYADELESIFDKIQESNTLNQSTDSQRKI